MKALIIPHALVIAAKTFAKNPKMVGEVLVALVNETGEAKLSDVQRYILGSCYEELKDLQEKREAVNERKRRSRLAEKQRRKELRND